MQFGAKISLVVMTVLLAGCSTLSSLNPFAGKSAPRNPPAALTEFKPSLAVRPAWTNSIGKAGEYFFTPAVAGNSVFAAAADGTLVHVDLSSGRELWRINAGVPLTAGVGTDGESIAVGAVDGTLLVFDMDGKQRWKAQASSEILSSPAVGQGLVVVRSIDNRIVAFDANSGARRWTVQRPIPPLTLRTAPGIALGDGVAYVALPGGRLVAIVLSNGAVRWDAIVGDPRGTTELERVADVSGMPAISGRGVCAVAYQGKLGCLDTASGAGYWAKDFSSDVGVAMDDRHVYAVNDRSAVHAFIKTNGTSVWRNDQLLNRGLTAPAALSGAVIVGDRQGYVHFLSSADGSFVARTETDGSRIIAQPLTSGTTVIVQTQAGLLAALKIDK